jgi:hypothetical protein
MIRRPAADDVVTVTADAETIALLVEPERGGVWRLPAPNGN